MTTTFTFEGEAEFPISNTAQSTAVFADNINIANSKLSADTTIQGTDTIVFELGLSATEGGSYTWEIITNGTLHYFTVTGIWLKWRARLTGFPGNNTYFENLRIEANKA